MISPEWISECLAHGRVVKETNFMLKSNLNIPEETKTENSSSKPEIEYKDGVPICFHKKPAALRKTTVYHVTS